MLIGPAEFFEGCHVKWLKVFDIFGEYSRGMWFFHAVFFATYVKDVFQPVMLPVKQPVLMYVWVVLLSLAGARLCRLLLGLIHKIPCVLRG